MISEEAKFIFGAVFDRKSVKIKESGRDMRAFRKASNDTCSSILNALKSRDVGVRKRRVERVAKVTT